MILAAAFSITACSSDDDSSSTDDFGDLIYANSSNELGRGFVDWRGAAGCAAHPRVVWDSCGSGRQHDLRPDGAIVDHRPVATHPARTEFHLRHPGHVQEAAGRRAEAARPVVAAIE